MGLASIAIIAEKVKLLQLGRASLEEVMVELNEAGISAGEVSLYLQLSSMSKGQKGGAELIVSPCSTVPVDCTGYRSASFEISGAHTGLGALVQISLDGGISWHNSTVFDIERAVYRDLITSNGGYILSVQGGNNRIRVNVESILSGTVRVHLALSDVPIVFPPVATSLDIAKILSPVIVEGQIGCEQRGKWVVEQEGRPFHVIQDPGAVVGIELSHAGTPENPFHVREVEKQVQPVTNIVTADAGSGVFNVIPKGLHAMPVSVLEGEVKVLNLSRIEALISDIPGRVMYKPERFPVCACVRALKATGVICEVSTGKVLYVSTLVLTAINQSATGFAEIVIRDGPSDDKIPFVISMCREQQPLPYLSSVIHFHEPIIFKQDVRLTILKGSVVASVSVVGFEGAIGDG